MMRSTMASVYHEYLWECARDTYLMTSASHQENVYIKPTTPLRLRRLFFVRVYLSYKHSYFGKIS